MSDLSERLASLSPEQRRLLAQMRRKKKGAAGELRAVAAPLAKLASEPFCMISEEERNRLPADVEDAYPLTRMQAGMLYHMELAPDYLLYQNVDSREQRFDFRPDLLQRAVQKVIARHSVLRTSFDLTTYGKPLQLVHETAFLPIAIEDLRQLAPPRQARVIQAYVAGEKRHRFDLARPPLLRFQIHRLSDERVQMTLTDFHPIIDGWSLNAVWQEIQRHFIALLGGRELPDEPPPAVPYREFVWLERQAIESEEAQRFWQGKLDGCSVLELPRWPAAWRDPASGDGGGPPVVKHVLTVRPAVFERLKQLSRSLGVPLKSILLAAHVKLMSLLGGKSDVLTGLTTHGRPELPGGEEVLGLFFNTVPLRQRLAPAASWRQVVRDSFELERELLPYRRYPLATLQQSWGRQALLETTFNVTQFHLAKGADPGAGGEPEEEAAGDGMALEENHFPLFAGFNISPGSTRLEVRLACHVEHLTREQIAEAALGYLRVLEAIAEDPDAPHDARDFHSPPARHRLLREWNDTAAPLPEASIHQLFERRVERTPEAVAAVFEGRALSYRELDRRAASVAQNLRRLGVGPDVLVGILMERSLDLLAAVLGVLKAGGAYVPLDPGYPRKRIAHVLEDSGIAVLLTEEPLRSAVSGVGESRVHLPAPWLENPAPRETGGALPVARPENAAYAIYTSGSTGRPKGVVVPHRAVVNFLTSMARQPGLGPEDSLLAVTTLAFDIAGLELFLPLIVGARVELASRELAADSPRLGAHLARGFTAMQATPATWRMLVQTGWRGEGLKVLCGGQALPPRLAAELAERGASVWNLYGPTETTIWSAVARVRRDRGDGESSVTIGAPIANTQIHVLDRSFHPAPLGTAGELVIGGAGVTRGYHRRPSLTAERFVPDPTSDRPGERLYRTGDLARWQPPGELLFLGRLDHQVKVRGFRIELGEIESVLEDHPALADCAAVARPEASGDARLVAYVVPRPGAEAPPVGELREHLLERLPDYMVPGAFLTLESLPLTPNGKLDRSALPDPEPARPELATPFVAPQSPLEERVAGIWAAVLELDRVGVNDRFFELGGHSLLAMQLIVRLREELGLELTLQALFEAPTVAALSRRIEDLRSAPQAAAAVPLPPVVPDPANRYQPFPLTDLQQGYWLGWSSAFELGNVSAHTYQEIDVDGLDVERLTQAWRRLIERHDALRLEMLPDGRQQILERVPPYEIAQLDLRGRDPGEAEAELMAIRRRMAEEGPPLTEWPLFELRCTRLEGRTVRFHISLSLMISDARSFFLLTQELIRLYYQPEAELAPLELSLRDYVVALRQLEEGEPFERALGYWRERLPQLPAAPDLPLAASPTDVATSHMARRFGILEREDWSRLKARASDLGVTATVLLAAVYAEVLATWSRRRHFLLNLLYFNRLPLHPEVNDLAANFSSTLLLEVDASGDGSFEDRVRHLQGQLWRDMDHALVSGVRVQRELAREQGAMAGAIAPVVFASTLNVNPVAEEPPPPPEARDRRPAERRVYNHLQTPQMWLDHQVHEVEGGLHYSWYSVDELFPPGLVEEMIGAYQDLLERLARRDEVWARPRPVTVPADQLAARAEVNRTAATLPAGLLQDRFREQVAATPEAPAVIASDRTLSYAELARRAGTLARRLRQLGASPGELVAVVMEKGWEQVVAVEAIVEAGAAYLPIDPALPEERIAYLLTSGRAELAVTRPSLTSTVAWPEAVRPVAVEAGDAAVEEEGPLPPVQDPSDLAYVLFTSGSTGFPKGVMIEHRAAKNTVVDVNRRFEVGPRDRVLALSALSFDLSVYDVFGLLSAGGAVVLPAADDLREPARWAELLADHRVTIWNSVPALMEMLVDHLEGHGERLPEDLRLVMMSGDWVPVDLPDRIRALAGDVEVVALGGATEASIWSILHPVGAVDPGWASIPYGRPMANQTFHVLDDALADRPAWVAGDLYIGGAGLARGYWRDEAKTAAAFITSPEGPLREEGERLYRTGDLGRYLPDGDIEFLGREDLQVKVQGYRIELGEIESTLARHRLVRSAVAAALGPRRGSKRLVAYVVPAPEQHPTAEELAEELASKLPGYMVPASFVFLDELPLTANGKVDRGALPDPDDRRSREGAELVPPRDELELALVRIWEEVLDRRPVGVKDSFFDLGGHSLAAVRLMSRIARDLGTELPLATLLEGSDVERLAAILRREGGAQESGRRALVAIQPQGEEIPFFCVHPVGGDVLCYVELARRLGGERPFYGLQTPYDGGPGSALSTVEEMAAHYVTALRSVQGAGPYLLGGWSMGGVVAFEMAQQLRREGEEIALLALVDASAPGASGAAPEVDDATLASWFARDLGQLVGVGCELSAEDFRGLDGEAQAARVLEDPELSSALPPGLSAADLGRHLEVFKGNYRALLTYVPRPYAGGLNLFLAAEEGGNARSDPAATWRELAADGVAVHSVPGDHYTMFRPPHLETLAEELGGCLAQADGARSEV